MGANGGLNNHKRNSGKVTVPLKAGQFTYLPFGGFLSAENVVGLRRLKVFDVRGLCIDDMGIDVRYQVPRDHYVVGTFLEGKVYLLLFDGEIRHYLIKYADSDGRNNVVSLV
ncbi:hypothetical protein J4N39_18260 [Vibrio sp. SCSIO 43136]|nr:hypothetical protein J4N39_18260 [Vibrio sp. SCSIO 43136]